METIWRFSKMMRSSNRWPYIMVRRQQVFAGRKHSTDSRICATIRAESGDRGRPATRSTKQKEIEELGLTREDQLSSPRESKQFVRQTGVDLIVPNLGTEHRLVAKGPTALQVRARAWLAPYATASERSAPCTAQQSGRPGRYHGGRRIIKVNFLYRDGRRRRQQDLPVSRANEAKLVEQKNLWLNSATWFHDIRRRHVAQVCYDMLATLGYERLVR